MTPDQQPATAASSRALGIAAAVIIVITAAFCTVFCLTVRGPWWGISLDCAGETGCALYAWWLIWRTERRREVTGTTSEPARSVRRD